MQSITIDDYDYLMSGHDIRACEPRTWSSSVVVLKTLTSANQFKRHDYLRRNFIHKPA